MSYKEKLKDIKAFVFDVDGVFTDGSVYLMPGGNMCRVMNVLDGYAVVKALKNNYLIGVITGGNDETVKAKTCKSRCDWGYNQVSQRHSN